MAKTILICFRNEPGPEMDGLTRVLNSRIAPDNADPAKPLVYWKNLLYMFTYNPAPTVLSDGPGVCLGLTVGHTEDVLKPRAPRPDGTFALFRADGEHVEIYTDCTASRTIWYLATDTFLVASTSQRMILCFLGSFEINETAIRWMLSTGTLGPESSWDSRVRPLPAGSALRLDRLAWELKVEGGGALDFNPANEPASWHEANLRSALEDSVAGLDIEGPRWTLALSGGVDSRSLAYHLRKRADLSAVTWGVASSASNPTSDASVAKTIARLCGFDFEYAATDFSASDFPVTLDRFMRSGEGRIDHLSGYMDGLELWAGLARRGRGIIRGYDALGGTHPVSNEYHVRRSSSMMLSEDYTRSVLPDDFAVSEQDLPENLRRMHTETLEQWRDGLWLKFRTPVMTAALDEIKVAYVEIVNPLLCSRILDAIRLLPDRLRTNKFIFRKIVTPMFPDVPFARRDSIQEVEDILNGRAIKAFMRRELLETRVSNILPDQFLDRLARNLDEDAGRMSARRRLVTLYRAHAPGFVRGFVRRRINRIPMDSRRVAMRAVITLRAHELLSSDAREGRDSHGGDWRP